MTALPPRGLLVVLGLAGFLAHGCAALPPPAPRPGPAVPAPRPPREAPKPPPPPPARPAAPEPVLARSDEYVVYVPGPGDTLQGLARRFLGDSSRAWAIADLNGIRKLTAGKEVVIPLKPQNPSGVYPDGYWSAVILCYHQFGQNTAKMVIPAERFAEQMDYLAAKGYRVIRLSDLLPFLRGEADLPKRAVVITIDDGYKSAYQIAYPILKRHGFPATIFVYTDFVNARAGLTWSQMRDMLSSGLIDIQPHSKSHSNMGLRKPGEDEAAYEKRVEVEIATPSRILRERLGITPTTFAYPYGDTNDFVIEQLQRAGFPLAATVQVGEDPAFAFPYMLRRNMVFGDDDLTAFKRKLPVFQGADLR